MLLSSVPLGALTRYKDFLTPPAWRIMMVPRYLPLPPSFTVKQVIKKIYRIFFDFVNISPIAFIAL